MGKYLNTGKVKDPFWRLGFKRRKNIFEEVSSMSQKLFRGGYVSTSIQEKLKINEYSRYQINL